MRLSSLAILAAALLVGCGSSTDNAPPAAAMASRTAPPPAKVPSTPEEKIQAIQNSSAPEDVKKAAIEKVKSGG